MERIISILAIAAIVSPVFSQEITNGGFEQWSTVFLFENPDAWSTGNHELPGLANTLRVTDAPEGQYAARLETVEANGEVAFGFALLGRFDEDPSEGVPFTTDISTLECQVRHGLAANDSALALLVAWSGGQIAAFGQWRFGGQQNAWTQVSLPLPNTVTGVDSVLVGFASSDPFAGDENAVAGSWLEVDDVRLTSPGVDQPDQLPNAGFEQWLDVEVEEPDGWSSFNPFTVVFGLLAVEPSTEAYEGSYAARITTIEAFGETLPGVLTNGTIGGGSAGGVPYSAEPALFTGAYKYTPAGADQGGIALMFLANGEPVCTHFEAFTESTAAWTSFSAPLEFTGTPDSLRITITSGYNGGSVLLVDALDLSGGNVGMAELKVAKDLPHPNPCVEHVLLPGVSAGAELRLLDMAGRVLHMQRAKDGDPEVIATGSLAPGAFVLEVRQDGQVRRHTMVKVAR